MVGFLSLANCNIIYIIIMFFVCPKKKQCAHFLFQFMLEQICRPFGLLLIFLFLFLWNLVELKSTDTAHHFSFLLNSTDYRILRMDEDHDRMYVGSKDYILSLDLHDINKEPLIVRGIPPETYNWMTSSWLYL